MNCLSNLPESEVWLMQCHHRKGQICISLTFVLVGSQKWRSLTQNECYNKNLRLLCRSVKPSEGSKKNQTFLQAQMSGVKTSCNSAMFSSCTCMGTRELFGCECLFHTSEFKIGSGIHWATSHENGVGFLLPSIS